MPTPHLLGVIGSDVAQAGLEFWVVKDNLELLIILPPPPVSPLSKPKDSRQKAFSISFSSSFFKLVFIYVCGCFACKYVSICLVVTLEG